MNQVIWAVVLEDKILDIRLSRREIRICKAKYTDTRVKTKRLPVESFISISD